VWPELSRLPHHGLRILDAGCGNGAWTLELAARRPGWQLVGVDYDRESLSSADESRRQLGLENVSFVESEFLAFRDNQRFDVVLSVCSSHYLAQIGQGPELFRSIHAWLKPDGLLFLLALRRAEGASTTVIGAQLPGWRVFSRGDLQTLCASSGLTIRRLTGRLGPLAKWVKRLDWACEGRLRFLNLVLYPAECGITFLDARINYGTQSTLMWLLVATASQP
jgi:SAM-dependent methyltransferase